MKCKSIYNTDQIYNYEIINRNKIKIFKEDFNILISKSMFNKLFEHIKEDE